MAVSGGTNDLGGLTSSEARGRLAAVGPNALPEAARTSVLRRLLAQFQSPLIYILLFALALDLVLWAHEGAAGIPLEPIAIGLILALNAGLGAFQESKAEEALARLKDFAKPFAWVMRDGELANIPLRDIVPGDIARIDEGGRIPADGRLVEGHGVLVDESILTGESLPVDKSSGSDMSCGTLVVRSKGYIEVTHTGAASTMGRLAAMIESVEVGKTPLERRLGEFGTQVTIGIFAVGVALTIGGVVIEGFEHLRQVALFSVALAVAVVPEGLPAVLTLTLTIGVERLAGRKAVIRRLSSVESLGSVTVIATDKTGTLTENRMQVRAIDAPDDERAMLAMVLANDAELATGAGDPLEVALLRYAQSRGANPAMLSAASVRVATQPFDSASRFMSVTVRDAGRHITYLKGAPEVLIERSSLSPDDRRDWEQKALRHAGEGYRVIAMAWQADSGDDNVIFLGLIMLWDPPRPEVRDALKRAKSAGIRVIMITGDHPATARAVAHAIGIETDRTVTGAQLDAMSPADVRNAIAEVNVFARVAPEHKLAIVEALKANGDIVAVTGDGVNDAAALKRSDVGIAMGQRGSDVTREVADIVLLDDNFATIVAAIEEGRSIYENIQKFIRFFFSTDLALVALMVCGLGIAYVLGMRDPSGVTFLLPLTAVQLLWINVVADGPPALALALDRNPGLMEKPPRPTRSKLLDAASMHFIAISGIAKAAGGVAIFAALPQFDYSLEETRTALFLFESMLQLVFAYPSRRVGVTPLSNPWIHVTVGFGVLLQILTVTVAPLRTLLGLVALDLSSLALILVGVVITWTIAEILNSDRILAPLRDRDGTGNKRLSTTKGRSATDIKALHDG